MSPLPTERRPGLAAIVGAGLLLIVVAVVGARLGGSTWPAVALASSLLAIVGVVVFVSAGFLYTVLFVRDLLAS